MNIKYQDNVLPGKICKFLVHFVVIIVFNINMHFI